MVDGSRTNPQPPFEPCDVFLPDNKPDCDMIVAVATPAATPFSHFSNFRSGNKRTDTAEICLDFDKVPRDDVQVLTERARMSRPLSMTVVLRAHCFTDRIQNILIEDLTLSAHCQ